MPLLGWIRCLICSALLFSSNPSEPANATQALDQHRLPLSNDETGSFLCSCNDKKGRTYNLASLAQRNGTPRFTVQAKDNYSYSFNPCFSFKLGPSFGDCSRGNVAVCRWTKTSHEKIGDQREVSCESNGTPKLKYETKPHSVWQSVVYLQCDSNRKSVESAEFLVTDDTLSDPVKFLLKHNCACPNACADERPTYISPTTGPTNEWETFAMPIIVSASVVFFIFVAVIAIKRSISGPRHPHERTPLIQEDDEHTGGHNSASGSSQTEESSGGDEVYLTPPSTITSIQDEPLTDPTVACKNNNTNKEIQGPVRKGSHGTEEAKV